MTLRVLDDADAAKTTPRLRDQALPALAIDSTGQILEANAAAAAFFRVTAESLAGRQFDDLTATVADKRQHHALAFGATAFKRGTAELGWGIAHHDLLADHAVISITPCDRFAAEVNRLFYQESIWRNAVESADHGVWDYNAIGDTRYHSDGWKRIRSIPDHVPAYNTYGAWISRIHPEDRDHVEEQIRLHNSGEIRQFRFEYRERDYNDNYVWVLSCGQSLEFDADGAPTRLVGVDVDITAIKEQEVQRRNELTRLHQEHLLQVEIEHKKTESARQEAHSLSRQDPLTLLSNRRVFSDEVNRL